jgi:uncharacterized membrane protein
VVEAGRRRVSKGRLEAFSDGVIAIIITIMVLELRPPEEGAWAALGPLWPVFSSYALSFVFIGIYWNNHHHLLQACRHVTGSVLWANLHLLFWLSLTPFVTAWMGESHFAAVPIASYGIVMLAAAIAYTILLRALIAAHGADSPLAHAVGGDSKGKLSLALYAVAIPLAFVSRAAAVAIFVGNALLWLVPDRRMERALEQRRV